MTLDIEFDENRINEKMQSLPDNCKIIYGDNNNFVHLSKDISVIDCDSYENPLPLIKKIVEISTVDKIIFFTWSRTNENSIRSKLYPLKEVYCIRSEFGHNTWYGYVIKRKNIWV